MAIKSVTTANLAEHIADKRAQGANIASLEQLQAMAVKTAEKPKEPPKDEAKEAAPEAKEAAEAKPQEKQKPKNSVQERIDELTREKRELEEFAEGEYSARLQSQRRISELEDQIKKLSPVEEKPKDPKPDRSKYTQDQIQQYEDDLLSWNRREARREFEAEAEKNRQKSEQEKLAAELNARREASIAAAKKELPDFDEVIQKGNRASNSDNSLVPPEYVKAVIWESEYGAHLLHYLASNPDEARRIFKMRPAKAALELGGIAKDFTKKAEPTETVAKAETPPAVPVSKAPPPMPSLNGTSGEVVVDLSAPQPFKEYQRKRIEEIRRNPVRRRH